MRLSARSRISVAVASTNRRVDNAGVFNILDPLKSRFATLVELTTSVEDRTTGR